jgi:hypothetical protein
VSIQRFYTPTGYARLYFVEVGKVRGVMPNWAMFEQNGHMYRKLSTMNNAQAFDKARALFPNDYPQLWDKVQTAIVDAQRRIKAEKEVKTLPEEKRALNTEVEVALEEFFQVR